MDVVDRILGALIGAAFGAIYGTVLKIVLQWPATAGVFAKWSTLTFAIVGVLVGPFLVDMVVGLSYLVFFVAWMAIFDWLWPPERSPAPHRRPMLGLLCLAGGTAVALLFVHRFPGISV